MFDWTEVWCVGNGPSRDRLLPTIPDGASVLAVNDALKAVAPMGRFDVALFSLDSLWIARNREYMTMFPGEKHLAVPLDTFPECAGVPGAAYYGWAHHGGLSDDPGLVATGGNSGYGALGICWHKGARVIRLAGYDMAPDWNSQSRFWAPLFGTMLPQLASRGVRVWNHSVTSSIDAFPFVTIPESVPA